MLTSFGNEFALAPPGAGPRISAAVEPREQVGELAAQLPQPIELFVDVTQALEEQDSGVAAGAGTAVADSKSSLSRRAAARSVAHP
jgi:hypothetical protein